MSKAYKCDRCGKLYEGQAHGKLIVGWMDFSYILKRDIVKPKNFCPECDDGLHVWINEYNKKEVTLKWPK